MSNQLCKHCKPPVKLVEGKCPNAKCQTNRTKKKKAVTA